MGRSGERGGGLCGAHVGAQHRVALPALASRAASKVEVELRVGATGAPLHAPLQLDHRVGKVLQR